MLGRLPPDSSIEKQKNYYLLKALRDENKILSYHWSFTISVMNLSAVLHKEC